MWKIAILSLFLLLQSFAPVYADAPYRVLYPYGLLTDDFGILDEQTDLGVDTWRGTPHPYDENGINGGYPYWSCYPTHQTSTSYETWRDSDPMGRADKIITMCSLNFVAETDHEIHRFVGRRAYPVEQCRYFTAEWKRIIRGQSHVCFNGYGGEAEPRKNFVEIKTEKIWTWDRIKTKSGCMSYFEGECDLKHWKKWRLEELSQK